MGLYATSEELGGTQQAIATSYKTLVSIYASATARRGKLVELLVGVDGTPADNAMEYDISRMTAGDGTATTVTPVPVNPADAACSATSKANYSVEPTVTAASSLLHVPLNQRASWRWVASPGGELVFPATTNNGLVARAKAVNYTGTASAQLLFEE